MFTFEVHPAVTTEQPVHLSVQLDTDSQGLAWCITAMNTTPDPIEGDIQVEWRLPELARDRNLIFTTNPLPQPRAMVIDFQPSNRPEAFAHLWIGERFSVTLPAGEWIQLTGFVQGSPDVDQDGNVAASDIAEVLSAWGSDCCFADINCDGKVESVDLVLVLGAMSGM
ncbi:MAG: hypothetical protein JNL80_00050 [Phycisphaerae bacterium]|nr:hypothetical protein [Phycisphaerae bacterium]